MPDITPDVEIGVWGFVILAAVVVVSLLVLLGSTMLLTWVAITLFVLIPLGILLYVGGKRVMRRLIYGDRKTGSSGGGGS